MNQDQNPDVDELYEFSKWFLSECSAAPIPPFKDGVHFLAAFVGTTMFRSGPYQVQMWTCAPNSVIPEHSHPGVDNIQIYLWGQVHLTHNGQLVINEDQMVENGGISAAYSYTIRIKPGETHGARIGPMGGSFLTIQKWLDGNPRSVATAWSGDPLNEEHVRDLKEPHGQAAQP
jgi:hypothetical protein